MMRNLILLGILMLMIGAYTWYADYHGARPTAAAPALQSSTQNVLAPDFMFQTLDGKKHSLSDFTGKAIVLNFWATWCAPCVIEFPQMIQLAQMDKEKTIFLFISTDESKADIERFVAKYGKDLPQQNIFIGWDKDKKISQSLYQTFRLPETYLIDSRMILKEKIIGADIDWLSEPVQQKINSLKAD